MVKGYYVQLIKKDNKNGTILEKFAFNRELNYSSCKSCYIDASNFLSCLGVHSNAEWLKVGGVLLGDYAEERDRLPKIKNLTHTSEYFTYLVTISCGE